MSAPFARPSAGSAVGETQATHLHSVAALLAAVLFLGGLAAVYLIGDRVIAHYIRGLAKVPYERKYSGIVLQREALRHPDLLSLYGTSEVFMDSPYHAKDLFADAPTGFSIFAVGRNGALVFTTLQSLGALGANLSGKKVVLSLSPPMFENPGGRYLDVRYLASFSPVQALSLFMSDDLSSDLKSDIAKRFLAHSSMLDRNKIADLLVNHYGEHSLTSFVLYKAIAPLAYLQRFLLELEDKTRVMARFVRTPAWRSAAKPNPRELDWAKLLADARGEYEPRASQNPFGVYDRWWNANEWKVVESRDLSRDDLFYRESDEQFLHSLYRAEAWLDLELTIRILKEVHADAMILSMPLHGSWWDYARVSAASRRQYYDRLRELGARYAVRTVVLDDHEADRYFFSDLGSHPSPVGWIHYDRAIDAFYHDRLN